ncbi:hypothetical protein AVEN_160757-1 [Araneus ventricosus]|uniref:Uncharacterized protein n=1 Tax=Araneus ventricosus TaxID=182803 RepID=A0A4Y2P6N2_ARAVE|nr:hypothetical protein AVEN_160757-1 [Araneus ventricosus]
MAMLEFKRTQNSTLHAPIPIWGLDARVASKDLPTLRPRVEGRNETRNLPRRDKRKVCVEFCDFEPCLKTNFGASVSYVPHFSAWMDGEKASLWTNGIEWSTDECRAFKMRKISDNFGSRCLRRSKT